MSKAKKVTGGIVAAIVIIVGLVLVAMSLKKVDAGYSGVVYSMNGGIEDRVLGQGWHWIKPGQKLIPYSIGIEQSYLTATDDGDSPEDDSFSAPSSDGKGLTMELTFTYRFDEDRLPEIFTRFKGRTGKEVLTTFIKPNILLLRSLVKRDLNLIQYFQIILLKSLSLMVSLLRMLLLLILKLMMRQEHLLLVK